MTRADEIRNLLKPLPEPEKGRIDSEAVRTSTFMSAPVANYLAYYGLDHEKHNPQITHTIGTFTSGGETLAGHIYLPSNYKAVIVLLHGYLGHSGQFKKFSKFFTEQGYAVACFDMPGHGLSSGARGDIEDFAEYTHALKVFTDYVSSTLHGPYHLVGFSTGSAVALDYTLTQRNGHYEGLVLTAPLVHSFAWKWALLGATVYQPFIQKVPRIHRHNSSDPEYVDFVNNKDHLQLNDIPLTWFEALRVWNDRVDTTKPRQKSALLLQGTKDAVIDYSYNVEFIKNKLPNVAVEYIQGGRHDLLSEAEEMRVRTFEKIYQWH